MAFLHINLVWLGVVGALIVMTVWRLRAYEVLGSREYPEPPERPFISVIIPARNESDEIKRCLDGVLSQTYPADRLEVLVVDDNSTDDTADIVRRTADSDSRVHLLSVGEKPRDWIGKNLACWLGAQAARGEWLCFIDSDTYLEPSVLSAAMRSAKARKADMLSAFPFLELEGIWERLIVPPGLITLLLSMNSRKINDPARSEAAASGAFMLVRRPPYESVGGHRAVRGKITEDIALARLLKENGHSVYLIRGGELIRARMFETLKAAWQGVPRIGIDAVGGRGAVLLFSVLALLTGWLCFIFSVWGLTRFLGPTGTQTDLAAFIIALIGLIALAGANAVAARACKIPVLYGLLFPIGLTLIAIAGINTVRLHTKGRARWGGREYQLLRETNDWISSE